LGHQLPPSSYLGEDDPCLQTDHEMTQLANIARYMEKREKMAIKVEFAEKSTKKFLASPVGKDLPFAGKNYHPAFKC
jgi:hypothetical protein